MAAAPARSAAPAAPARSAAPAAPARSAALARTVAHLCAVDPYHVFGTCRS
ncbi:hypothetical protein ACQP2P_32690 [Dactylosporangium sp. CA-139114]|uniref:hypothetical protein n=1 Tax=Dactylosporangium sp. CA-139114 TaxID=3239931 RepID=UPI003D985800